MGIVTHCRGFRTVNCTPAAMNIKREATLLSGFSPCWRYLSFRAVSSQVLSAEASLTSVFGMGTGGPSP